MKVVAFLPAKGTSSRVQNKNIKLLDGKPLFLHALEMLSSCDFLDEVYLDTESEEVISLASEVDCKVLRRDKKLADNKTDGNVLFLNEVKQVDADIYVQMLCTSPFIEKSTIEQGVNLLKEKEEYDSVVLVRNEKLYTWSEGQPNYNINHIPNSVELSFTTIETMGLYIIRKTAALETNRRIGNTPYLLNVKPLEAFDVNWPEDFEMAELIAAGRREKSRKLLANIRNQITSCLLSDLLDDFGYKNQVVKGLSPNFESRKIFGRAKTLKLRELKEGEDFKGIYNALYSYETIVPDDIIVVENELKDYAYFGELNANLAIRSGAGGVIVNGMTRDVEQVRALGLTVFSQGKTCQDVRCRATTESFNKTIQLNGVLVKPNDLIFADAEGVVVIPQNIEQQVINEIYKRISTEKKIIFDISRGANVDDLTKKYGFF